jgi:hypothetical protein
METKLGECARCNKAICRYSRLGRDSSRGYGGGKGGEEATVAFWIDKNRDNVDGLNLAL